MGSKEEKKKKGKKSIHQQMPLGEGYLEAVGAGRCGGLGHPEAGEERRVGERLVHEPVSLKACLCLASLLEAHLLISTKEKNGVGNMWMSSLPCLGSQVPRTKYPAWGRKQGE